MSAGQRRRWRRQLVERDGAFCHLCGEQFHPEATIDNPMASHPLGMTIDHLVPRSAGAPRNRGPKGTFGRANMKLAHAACNVLRGSRPLPLRLDAPRETPR